MNPPTIHVDPKFAREMFRHFTERSAVECCRDLFRISFAKGQIVCAAPAKPDDKIAHAAASEIHLAGGSLPRDVQWMPPGLQTVQPQGFDEPFDMNVTAQIAKLADSQLQQLRSAAAAGRDVEPYIDFNHKDEGRAFKPTRFYWAGEDPKNGGIRATGTWTGAGAKAVLDGELCCVSASWVLHKDTKQFLGIRHNVGGLVPRSAFHSIQAFAKADTSKATNNNTHNMTKEEISQVVIDALKPIHDKITALEANAKAAETTAAAGANTGADDNKIVQLVTAAIKPLADKMAAIETGNQAQLLASAKSTVEAIGIKAGRIGAQDTATIEFWTKAVAADAKAAEALGRMPVNPAFASAIANGSSGTSTGTGGEHEFVKLVTAKAKAGKSKADAITEVVNENNAVYVAWLKAGAGAI